MLGNGFAWGQSSHLLAWIYHVCGKDLCPQKAYCTMHHSKKTGADVAHSASIKCNNGVTMSLSGTSLLPGNAHSEPPVGKQIEIKIYGTQGAIHYGGDDRDSASGRLELRIGTGEHEGAVEVQCPDLGFQFEELDDQGTGPQSLQNFLAACRGEEYYVGADSLVGLKSIQTLDAMYRSEASGNAEDIVS
jgi:predicted dehydrogenase